MSQTIVPTPQYAVYGAAKAVLEGFPRSLRVEWGMKKALERLDV